MIATTTNPPSGAELLVDCEAVTKTFRDGSVEVRALRGVDLQVWAGEMMLLVGPSGCGKTTLLSVIAGILDATSGSTTVLGEDIAKMSPRRNARFRNQNLGFVFQQFNLFPTLTVAENVAVPLVIAGLSKRVAVDRAAELLKQVGLGDRYKSVPSQLSGGQQQRVAIARALINQPRLIVCDEPTSALDEATGKTIMDLLKNVAATSRRAVVVVTHDQRIFSYGDRIVEMNDGAVTGQRKTST